MFSARSSAFQRIFNIGNRHAWSKVLVHDTPSLRGGVAGPSSYPSATGPISSCRGILSMCMRDTARPPSGAGDFGSTVPQRRYRGAYIATPRECGNAWCAPWRSGTCHGRTCYGSCEFWRGGPHRSTTPHCRRVEPLARGPNRPCP